LTKVGFSDIYQYIRSKEVIVCVPEAAYQTQNDGLGLDSPRFFTNNLSSVAA
jgi:hypothetical protein